MAGMKTWYPWFPADYAGDCGHLRTIEHGAYRLILDYLWLRRTPIENSDAAFMRVTRTTAQEWAEMRATIQELLTLTDKGWVQKRLEAEFKRATHIYKKRVEGGRKTAAKFKGLKRSPSGQHIGEHGSEQPSEHSAVQGGEQVAQQGGKHRTITPTKGVIEGNPPSGDRAGSGTPEGSPDRPAERPFTDMPTADEDDLPSYGQTRDVVPRMAKRPTPSAEHALTADVVALTPPSERGQAAADGLDIPAFLDRRPKPPQPTATALASMKTGG